MYEILAPLIWGPFRLSEMGNKQTEGIVGRIRLAQETQVWHCCGLPLQASCSGLLAFQPLRVCLAQTSLATHLHGAVFPDSPGQAFSFLTPLAQSRGQGQGSVYCHRRGRHSLGIKPTAALSRAEALGFGTGPW